MYVLGMLRSNPPIAAEERPYSVQLHIHGPGSEGTASMRAHDYMAAGTGAVDAIWWTEHDWRLVNFCKVEAFSFDADKETPSFPARVARDGESPDAIEVAWVPDEHTRQTPGCSAGRTKERSFDGTTSLRLAASTEGDAENTSRCVFTVENMRGSFPLFSRPRVGLAVFAEADPKEDGEIFIEIVLSEQPPGMEQARLRYVWPPWENQGSSQGSALTLPLDLKVGQWTRVDLDPAADAAGLGLPARGLDNSLHRIWIGVTARRGKAAACFDALRIEPRLSGGALLEAQRELLGQLPLSVKHFAGMEVSFYGHHMNAFGSRVPVPDYFSLPPSALTTRGIVDHIHRFDGLACYNHPRVADPERITEELLQTEAYGADLIEVAHQSGRNLAERLRLWDALSAAGILLTGLGVSDAHQTGRFWEETETESCGWVTHVWASALEEEALLAGLRAGRAYFADPSQFRGTLDLHGPGGLRLGDARIESGPCSIEAWISGACAGDTIAWIVNGEVVREEHLDAADGRSTWRSDPTVDPIRAVRFELRRRGTRRAPDRAVPVACSNPVFLINDTKTLRQRDRHRIVNAV